MTIAKFTPTGFEMYASFMMHLRQCMRIDISLESEFDIKCGYVAAPHPESASFSVVVESITRKDTGVTYKC